ncbi:porin [Ursidibacter arcticus]
MKKTLVALAVTAFATSASALTVYENEGSKVDFDGSIRLRLDQEKSKTDNETTKRAHSNLHNDGSRFGIKTKHSLSEELFAFSRLEFRFNGGDKAKSTDQFGDLYAHRAYVGIGSKQFGEVSFGRQVTIGDDIAQAGFDEAYGVLDTTLTTSGKAVVRYDYKGIEGLQVGVDYRFAEDREPADEKALEKSKKDAVSQAETALVVARALNKSQADIDKLQEALTKAEADLDSAAGEVLNGKLKSGYGVGVTYGFKVAEGQSAKVAAGYTRDNFATGTNAKHHKDAWATGASYSINDLTLAADYAGSFEKKADRTSNRFNGFRVGAKYNVTPAVAVYANYGHGVAKTKNSAGVNTEKKVFDKFMLGSSYQVHKNVFTYVEGSVGTEKETKYANNVATKSKTTESKVGVGLRVFW